MLAGGGKRWFAGTVTRVCGGGRYDVEYVSHDGAKVAIRVGALVVWSIVAFLTFEEINIVEAVTGGACTMMTSVVLPLFFAMRLFPHSNVAVWAVEIFLCAFGLFTGIALTALDFEHLAQHS